MREKKNKIVPMILSMSLILLVIGITYAAFVYVGKGTKENTLTTGTISFVYNETSNGVSITNAYPMDDENGKLIQDTGEDIEKGYFDFEVKSTQGPNTIIPYYVYAVDISEEENKLDPQYIKIYLTNQEDTPYEQYNKETVPVYTDLEDIKGTGTDNNDQEGKLLYQDTFTESGIKDFRLRLWVANDYEITDEVKKFKMRVDVSTDVVIVHDKDDDNSPICEITEIQPMSATKDDVITMSLECSDPNDESITDYLTSNNIHVKINDEEIIPKIKKLSEGVMTTVSVTGQKIQHTLTLSGFEKTGNLSITIDKGKIINKKGRINKELLLNPGVKILDNMSNGLPVTNVDDYNTATEEEKHEMFEFHHDSTSQLEENIDYRYIGSNPYNYVTFNGEYAGWRIIGVFNEPNATGKTEYRIKLIRDKEVELAKWNDTTESHNWNNSTLKAKLPNYITVGSNEIENMKWYLGGASSPNCNEHGGAEFLYSRERGTKVYSSNPLNSTGTVGLMYPSDYHYTYGKGVDQTCFSSNNLCSSSNPKSGWMFLNKNEWTIMPMAYNSPYESDAHAWIIHSNGSDCGAWVDGSNAIRPVVYLKSNIGFTIGSGTKEDPYTVG